MVCYNFGLKQDPMHDLNPNPIPIEIHFTIGTISFLDRDLILTFPKINLKTWYLISYDRNRLSNNTTKQPDDIGQLVT